MCRCVGKVCAYELFMGDVQKGFQIFSFQLPRGEGTRKKYLQGPHQAGAHGMNLR